MSLSLFCGFYKHYWGEQKECANAVYSWNWNNNDLGEYFVAWYVAYISLCRRRMITGSMSYISKLQSQYSSWQLVKVTVTTLWLLGCKWKTDCQWTMSINLRKDVIYLLVPVLSDFRHPDFKCVWVCVWYGGGVLQCSGKEFMVWPVEDTTASVTCHHDKCTQLCIGTDTSLSFFLSAPC